MNRISDELSRSHIHSPHSWICFTRECRHVKQRSSQIFTLQSTDYQSSFIPCSPAGWSWIFEPWHSNQGIRILRPNSTPCTTRLVAFPRCLWSSEAITPPPKVSLWNRHTSLIIMESTIAPIGVQYNLYLAEINLNVRCFDSSTLFDAYFGFYLGLLEDGSSAAWRIPSFSMLYLRTHSWSTGTIKVKQVHHWYWHTCRHCHPIWRTANPRTRIQAIVLQIPVCKNSRKQTRMCPTRQLLCTRARGEDRLATKPRSSTGFQFRPQTSCRPKMLYLVPRSKFHYYRIHTTQSRRGNAWGATDRESLVLIMFDDKRSIVLQVESCVDGGDTQI